MTARQQEDEEFVEELLLILKIEEFYIEKIGYKRKKWISIEVQKEIIKTMANKLLHNFRENIRYCIFCGHIAVKQLIKQWSISVIQDLCLFVTFYILSYW